MRDGGGRERYRDREKDRDRQADRHRHIIMDRDGERQTGTDGEKTSRQQ